MRLSSIEIDDWKNLKGLRLEFGQDSFTSVLVGRNATAKSNLLEALVIIFRDLDLGELPDFKYALEYTCRGHEVRVDADPSRTRGSVLKMTVDGRTISSTDFAGRARSDYLPSNVFVYYSGHSDRMLGHFSKHEEQFDKSLRAGQDQALRPLLYIRLLHSKFALLAFFLEDDDDQSAFLRRYLRIEDLASVLFVLHRPYWYSANRRLEGDARFWGAKGVVRDLLDRLYRFALFPLRLQSRGTRGRSTDRLYLFLRSKEDLRRFGEAYGSGRDFFKALDSMHLADLVEDVRAHVVVRGVDGSLTFKELSEGEQQLLMVLGLLRFTREEESLILLDEPDTHLNPAWSLNYVDLIRSAVPEEYGSHVLMATHDPLVVAGLRSDEVHVMYREETGRVVASHPKQDPMGMGIAGLLTSEVYGLRSDLDSGTLGRLDLRRRLAVQEDLSEAERKQLTELNEWAESQDFTRTDRDPLYKSFVDAMTAWQERRGLLDKQTLTEEERERQQTRAKEVIERLQAED